MLMLKLIYDLTIFDVTLTSAPLPGSSVDLEKQTFETLP